MRELTIDEIEHVSGGEGSDGETVEPEIVVTADRIRDNQPGGSAAGWAMPSIRFSQSQPSHLQNFEAGAAFVMIGAAGIGLAVVAAPIGLGTVAVITVASTALGAGGAWLATQ